jgi:Ca2+/Na+ antiporter
LITALLFVASAVLLIIAAELFTNAVEWAGYRLRLGSGATGSLLAAVGTSLPETIVPVVALATKSRAVINATPPQSAGGFSCAACVPGARASRRC